MSSLLRGMSAAGRADATAKHRSRRERVTFAAPTLKARLRLLADDPQQLLYGSLHAGLLACEAVLLANLAGLEGSAGAAGVAQLLPPLILLGAVHSALRYGPAWTALSATVVACLYGALFIAGAGFGPLRTAWLPGLVLAEGQSLGWGALEFVSLPGLGAILLIHWGVHHVVSGVTDPLFWGWHGRVKELTQSVFDAIWVSAIQLLLADAAASGGWIWWRRRGTAFLGIQSAAVPGLVAAAWFVAWLLRAVEGSLSFSRRYRWTWLSAHAIATLAIATATLVASELAGAVWLLAVAVPAALSAAAWVTITLHHR